MEDPLFKRLRLHSEKKLRFLPGADREVILAACKDFLRLENQMSLRYHRKGDGGGRVAFARACLMDVIIEALFAHALNTFEDQSGTIAGAVCTVALGGYGRAELCPYSDIDLMFLYADADGSGGEKLEALQKALAETLLYVLWDLGLKVGHSTRTVEESIGEARNNIKSKNAMLEARLVAGSGNLFDNFQKRYQSFCAEDDPVVYFEDRLKNQKARRKRFGGTVFLQEPDVKNGVGGLRDFQSVLWMSSIKLGAGNLEALEKEGYLRQDEKRDFEQAYDFLLRVRNELHFQTGRPGDVLCIERQPEVALNLGYREEDIFPRVEAFMKDYYSAARKIYQISTTLEQGLTRQTEKSVGKNSEKSGSRSGKTVDGFILREGVLTFEKQEVFKEDPERLIRVFRHSQQFQADLDFELKSLVNESLPLITGKVINSPAANRSFRSLLLIPGEVYPTLSLMHELGVLGRFVPEFDALTCLVQHEYYHRYTADIHTLETIHRLDRIFSRQSPFANRYNREIHQTETPGLLYIILLLHDIGKGVGIKGHAARGAALASGVIDRLQLSGRQKKQVLFVIENHLEMSRFWQKHDVDDPIAAEKFAELVGNTENLRLLYVHTYCDARGTSAPLWNGFKDMLHTRLFDSTLAALGEIQATASTAADLPIQTSITRESLAKLVTDIPVEEIEAHCQHLPDRYFSSYDMEEVILHLRMVNALLSHLSKADALESLEPIIDWRNDLNLSVTEVQIVTWDRPGLFYKLAGTFSLAGLNIISSKAISRDDHIMIDTFYVCEPGGGVAQSDQAREVFRYGLTDSLLHDRDILPEIVENAEKLSPPLYLRKKEHLPADILSTVEVYRDERLKRTFVEVKARDRIGLLYRIAKTISRHGFDIAFARILTERGIAVDTFTIEGIDQTSDTDENLLETLKKDLESVISAENYPLVTVTKNGPQ